MSRTLNNDKRISLMLPSRLYAVLKKYAARQRISVSHLIRESSIAYVKEEIAKERATNDSN